MKRWYLVAAVAGLWSFAPLSAQEGSLAPTAPVVPTPVLQSGKLIAPSGSGNWGTSSRQFALTKWSPFRNPATASATEPVSPSAANYVHPTPPTPVGGGDGSCGPGGCGGRERVGWDRVKAFLCYHPSKTELPKLRPTPYVTPLIGMFPCSSAPNGGCATANGTYGQPLGPPQPYMPQPQPGQPMTQPVPPTAGAVMMPPRGTQGTAIQPTWQGRVTPAPADPGLAGYRFTAPGPVVNTGLKVPAPK